MVIRRIAQRIGWTLVVVWFVVTATFAMLSTIPEDPARALLGPHAPPEATQRVREHYCLDQGTFAQYGCWLANVARGDLGESYASKRPVVDIIADRAWPTVQLALATLVLQLAIGIPLGLLAAARRRLGRAMSVVEVLGLSAPAFVVGTVLLYLFAYQLGWFPLAGYGDGVLGRLHHLALPAAALASFGAVYYAGVLRAELRTELARDYVRTARAKGVAERDVLVRHALRPALGALVALVGTDLGALLGGAVVVESLFAWPGLGREALQAILELDLPVIVGVVMVSAIAVVVANLVADLVHLWLDPRLRDNQP
ncbi:MAG: ABC transporter permease [Kofleriaceae bacterium]|nr:ABC transporter permease [Kofleriaceae bacterium]